MKGKEGMDMCRFECMKEDEVGGGMEEGEVGSQVEK